MASTEKAADFLQSHSGDVSGGLVGGGVASGFCGPLAPGCATIVGLVAGSYYEYGGAVQNAARDGRCLVVYFGDTAGGGVNGTPYVSGHSGPGCMHSGGPSEMTDDIVRSVLDGGGG